MSLFSVIQLATQYLGNLATVGSIIGNTDPTSSQLLALANVEGRFIREEIEWVQLTKTYTVPLIAGVSSYALPLDFDYHVASTMWSNGRIWEVFKINAQEYSALKYGLISSTPFQRFRVKGFTSKQLVIFPTPGTGDATSPITFEYQSKSWILPISWVSGGIFTLNQYCSYDGNVYKATVISTGGIAGTTPPTHLTGSVSDGLITWTFDGTTYDSFRADTDISQIDEDLLMFRIVFRFLEIKGLDYKEAYRQYLTIRNKKVTSLSGVRTIDLSGNNSTGLMSELNIPSFISG